jgi:dihydrofolate reductase
MATVLAHTTMSLDGFTAGPNDEMDWVFEHAGDVPAALVDEVIATTGAILGGRRGYEVGRRAERTETSRPFGGRWSGPIFVLTHEPPADEPDPAYTFLSGDVREALDTALAAAGGRNLLVLGANVVGQCLRAGLLDEVLIHVLPVLLGDGVRLFEERGVAAGLDVVDVSRSGQVVNLRYRVRPQVAAG